MTILRLGLSVPNTVSIYKIDLTIFVYSPVRRYCQRREALVYGSTEATPLTISLFAIREYRIKI